MAAIPSHRIVLALMVRLAVALRWRHLGRQSLWIDEITEGTAAQRPLHRFVGPI